MGRKRIGLVLDHDGTMTVQAIESAWVVEDNRCLRGMLKEKNQQIHKRYKTLYEEGRLSQSDEIAWAKASVDLYREGNVTLSQVREALADVRYRPGLLDHLAYLRELDIPISINSWGIREFIEIRLKQHGATHLIDRIDATSLVTDGDRIVGIDEHTVVCPSNKGLKSLEFARTFDIPPKNLLAITDSPRDHRIGYRSINRLGVTDKRSDLALFRDHPAFAHAVHLADERFDPAVNWVLERLLQLL
jgi:phosphoserine phosphatase